MKIAYLVVSWSIFVLTACESTDEVLNKIDHTVPSVQFSPDTIEVAANENLTINAVIEDESGIQRIEFTYGDWRINKIVDLSNESNTVTYPFLITVQVPPDAVKEWQEDHYFNDGSSIKVIQQYHKLTLNAWDKNRNLNKSFLYVKVKK